MKRYHCYFMNRDGIRAIQTLELDDDAEVVHEARALLEAKPEHEAMEIWDGTCLISRLAKSPPKVRVTGKIYRFERKPK